MVWRNLGKFPDYGNRRWPVLITLVLYADSVPVKPEALAHPPTAFPQSNRRTAYYHNQHGITILRRRVAHEARFSSDYIDVQGQTRRLVQQVAGPIGYKIHHSTDAPQDSVSGFLSLKQPPSPWIPFGHFWIHVIQNYSPSERGSPHPS